jgi:hypothetical protein
MLKRLRKNVKHLFNIFEASFGYIVTKCNKLRKNIKDSSKNAVMHDIGTEQRVQKWVYRHLKQDY